MTHNPPTSQPDLDAIQARIDAASKGPWKLAYEYCDCSEDCGHGLYVSRIDTGSGPATELCDLPRGEWELMVHARADVEQLVDEVRRLRAQVAAVTAVHEKGEHNGFDICLECASQMFPPPETGIWSESAWPCATLRALGVDDEQPAVRPAVETGA